MTKKIAFLLGAGVSFPASFPKTEDITSRILSGSNVIRHTDSTYYFSESLPSGDPSSAIYVKRITNLLSKLAQINKDNNGSQPANYEDLYFLINQIRDNELGEFENPIVDEYSNQNRSDFYKIACQDSCNEAPSWKVAELFNETGNYIRDVVWRMLQKGNTCTSYLKNICDSCTDNDIETVDIYSLNHDGLIEEYFDKLDVKYNCGFGQQINGVRYWDPNILETSVSKVRLIKLHGSINWFQFPQNRFSLGTAAVGIPPGNPWDTLNPDGEKQFPREGRPLFLAGTFNKMLQYTSGIFADLHCTFRRSLRTVQHLVICGYSFGDKGINSQIIEWMYQANNKHLIVIHKHPISLLKDARGAIRKNCHDWVKNGSLSCIEAWIQHVHWQEIKKRLNLTG